MGCNYGGWPLEGGLASSWLVGPLMAGSQAVLSSPQPAVARARPHIQTHLHHTKGWGLEILLQVRGKTCREPYGDSPQLPAELCQVIHRREKKPSPRCGAGQAHRPTSALASPPSFPWTSPSLRGEGTGPEGGSRLQDGARGLSSSFPPRALRWYDSSGNPDRNPPRSQRLCDACLSTRPHLSVVGRAPGKNKRSPQPWPGSFPLGLSIRWRRVKCVGWKGPSWRAWGGRLRTAGEEGLRPDRNRPT